jgi:hypothetical protein
MEECYQVLDNVTMEDEEEPDLYSDKYENYCRLQRTVTFLTNGGRVTEEWMEEHRLHILKYREIISDYTHVNDDIKDPDFRKTAQETEVLLSNLVQSISVNRFFNVRFYIMLNQHMLKLCEYFFSEEELELCMSKLSI